jgi:hypothetical protein
MLTASPVTGVVGPAGEVEVPAGAAGVDGIPLMPGMPGVVAPDPKVTAGETVLGGDEHPASSSTASSATRVR